MNEIITVHLGPRQVVAMLSLDFDDTLPLSHVEITTERIEAKVKAKYPEVFRLFVRAQSPRAARDERATPAT
jgi:divalent metal cation (Fe/Co/Zn/Cd) transporter